MTITVTPKVTPIILNIFVWILKMMKYQYLAIFGCKIKKEKHFSKSVTTFSRNFVSDLNYRFLHNFTICKWEALKKLNLFVNIYFEVLCLKYQNFFSFFFFFFPSSCNIFSLSRFPCFSITGFSLICQTLVKCDQR